MTVRFSGRSVCITELAPEEGGGFKLTLSGLGECCGGCGDTLDEAIQSLVATVEMNLVNEEAIEEHRAKGAAWAESRFSFPISSEPVSQGFIDEVLDEVCSRGTVPFQRAFEEDVK